MSDCVQWWGTIQTYGVLKKNGKMIKAHRFIYEECFGPIPSGMVIRHTCDNPPCVNPEHLLIGTHQDNMNDKMTRGRGVFPGRPRTTHCPRGHRYDEKGRCPPCQAEANRRYRLRQKAK